MASRAFVTGCARAPQDAKVHNGEFLSTGFMMHSLQEMMAIDGAAFSTCAMQTLQDMYEAKNLALSMCLPPGHRPVGLHYLGEVNNTTMVDSVPRNRGPAKKKDLLKQYMCHMGPITTVMVCDLPCCVTHKQLAKAIEGLGFSRRYDLLHLPAGGRSASASSSNLGYGFVNFKAAEDACAFLEAFDGYKFHGTCSQKVCTVRPAHVQGFMGTLEHFGQKSGKRCSRGSFVVSL
uniref:RRM domain-containing protein n=1 Tax=Pyrodinium bahamense TaxID=73915 RepID=A0A7S0AE21_9DINO